MMKLLVTGAWNCTKEQLNSLKTLGNDILFLKNESDDLPKGTLEVEGIICNGLFLYHDIRKFLKLRYIQLTSTGYDRVPMEYINEKQIEIHNAKGVYSIPMAEFTICGVLQLLKHSHAFMQNQENCKWEKDRSLGELFGKKICIIGCGSVGTEVAKRFSAFGCKIIGVDLFSRNDQQYSIMYHVNDIEKPLKQSDIIVLTVPLTEQTKYLINKDTIKFMKQNTILVNIARGQIINTDDLIDALKEKRIFGAVLDVFEEEPLDTKSPLWKMENVIITPHNSFVGDGNSERLWEVIKNNMEKIK